MFATTLRSKQRIFILVTVSLTVLTVVVWSQQKKDISRVSSFGDAYYKTRVASFFSFAFQHLESQFAEKTTEFHLNVSIVSPDEVVTENETIACIQTFLPQTREQFPICVYNSTTDVHISMNLRRGVYYESNEVYRFLHLLRQDRGLHLVDIGANIGLFSLPAARVTRVVAVEPNWSSMLRLAKAVNLGAIGPNIILVNNAISNVRTTVYMGVEAANQGSAFVMNTTECQKSPENFPCRRLPQAVKTVLLNDLLPLTNSSRVLLKVDAQGHEFNIFTESAAGQFFDKVDIPLVFMEWILHRNRPSDDVRRFLNFFQKRHYAAFNTSNFELVDSYYANWPINILFKKLYVNSINF